MKNVAIIGAGNLGGAVALGLRSFAPEYSLTVTTAHSSTLEKYKALGICTALDNTAAAEWADIVILGVKPWFVQSVLSQILPALGGKEASSWDCIPKDAYALFGRPILGGFDRKGEIHKATPDETAEMARKALQDGPAGHMMLGADCTVPFSLIENIHAAVAAAHGRR